MVRKVMDEAKGAIRKNQEDADEKISNKPPIMQKKLVIFLYNIQKDGTPSCGNVQGKFQEVRAQCQGWCGECHANEAMGGLS